MEQYGFSPAGDLRLVDGQGLTVEIVLKSRTTGAVTDASGKALRLSIFRFRDGSVVAGADVGAVVAGNARFGLTPIMVSAGYAAGRDDALGWQVTSPDGSIVYLAPRGFAVGPAADLSGSGDGGAETWQLTVDPTSGLVASITVTGVPGPGAAQQLADLGTIDAPTPQALEAWLRALAAAPKPITADSSYITADDTILSRSVFPIRWGIDDVADVCIYGTNIAAIICAAYMRLYGVHVVLVGEDHVLHPGGIVASGLGLTDLGRALATNPFGGMARQFLRDVSVASGITGTSTLVGGVNGDDADDGGGDAGDDSAPATVPGAVIYHGPTEWARKRMEPRFVEQVCWAWLKRYSIPVIWGQGVTSVQKTGTRITSILAETGEEVRADYFVEAGYFGDLMARAGVSYSVGRPAASPLSPNGGYLGTANTIHNQFPLDLPISPFRIDGDETSGLLPGVEYETETVGQADTATQAHNYRLCMTKGAPRMVPLPTTPPDGYDPINFERDIRYAATLAANNRWPTDPSTGQASYFNRVFIIASAVLKSPYPIYDINSHGPTSTDLVGGSAGMLEASYADRAAYRQAHRDRIMGLFWTFQHSADPRIPAHTRAEALTFGFDRENFRQPFPGDPMYFPYSQYVRQPRLLVKSTGITFSEADNIMAPGTIPRSIKTIGTVCYAQDIHQHGRKAVQNASGVWCLLNEGEYYQVNANPSALTPIPLDITLPDAAECTNLFCLTTPDADPLGYSKLRMEPALWTMGQGLGAALVVAVRKGTKPDLQALDYDEIRAQLLATVDQIAPVLPQTN